MSEIYNQLIGKKKTLESLLSDALKQFEAETGLSVTQINLTRSDGIGIFVQKLERLEVVVQLV